MTSTPSCLRTLTRRGAAALIALLATAAAASAQLTFTEYDGPTSPTFEAGNVLVDITAGPDGNLWFTEGYAFGAQTAIGRISPSGVMTLFPIPSGDSEGGITAGPDGNLWFTEYRTNKIGRVTTAGVFTEFSLPGSVYPLDIAAGPDGNLWFTETYSNHIGRITPEGVITEFAIPSGNISGQITAGPDGNLWFTEHTGNKIGRITPSGVVTEFDIPTPGSYPFGITAGPDGNLWFTENSGDKIGRITPSGVITEFTIPTPDCEALEIVTGPDGNLWFTERGANQIARITTAGVITEFPVPTPDSQPFGITTGPDGNLWFTELHGNKIVKVTIGATLVPTNVTLSNVTGFVGQRKALSAKLRRSDNNATLSGMTVTFKVDGAVVGSGVTNSTGSAAFTYTLPESLGAHTLTAEFAGDATFAPSASANQTLTVNFATTTLTVANRSVQAGGLVNLVATLKGAGGNYVAGRSVAFTVDGVSVGSATTGANGQASFSYRAPLVVGSKPIGASFVGDAFFGSSANTGTLTLTPAATGITVYNVTAKAIQTVTLKARLRRASDGAYLAGQSVAFTVDGIAIGSATTDAGGYANVLYTPTTVGTVPVVVTFAGDAVHAASSGSGTLTLNQATTKLAVTNLSVIAGQTVTLKARLTRTADSASLVGKIVQFSVNGVAVGSGTTDAGGYASLLYTPGAAGSLPIQASFAGDTYYLSTTGTGTLTVAP